MRHVVLCRLRPRKTSHDPLGPEQPQSRTRACRCTAELGQLILGPRTVTQSVVGGLALGEAGGGTKVANSFLDEKTAWIHVAKVSAKVKRILVFASVATVVAGAYYVKVIGGFETERMATKCIGNLRWIGVAKNVYEQE